MWGSEPRAEVDRPVASQGIEIVMRSLFELPVTQNHHTVPGYAHSHGPAKFEVRSFAFLPVPEIIGGPGKIWAVPGYP